MKKNIKHFLVFSVMVIMMVLGLWLIIGLGAILTDDSVIEVKSAFCEKNIVYNMLTGKGENKDEF